ncbi:MAG TPA: tetratricopeptide repeat protein [Elusimicrobiales bacterium]|nr:tetratricopeptide repeat protein [Elusimicrobiales bacterium]
MVKKWAKQEVAITAYEKRVQNTKRVIKKYKTQILVSILVAVLIAIFIAFLSIKNKKMQIAAWQDFATAEQELQQSSNPTEVLEKFDGIVEKYPNSNAAAYALILKGDILYDNAKYDEAAKSYGEIIANNPSTSYVPFAINSLLYCYLAQNKDDDFIKTAENFVKKYPNHLLAPQIYSQLAGVYGRKGNKLKTKEIYEILSDNYSESPWGQSANVMLDELVKQKENDSKKQETKDIPKSEKIK